MSRQLNESSIFGTISAKEVIILKKADGTDAWLIDASADGEVLQRSHKEGVPLVFVLKEETIA